MSIKDLHRSNFEGAHTRDEAVAYVSLVYNPTFTGHIVSASTTRVSTYETHLLTCDQMWAMHWCCFLFHDSTILVIWFVNKNTNTRMHVGDMPVDVVSRFSVYMYALAARLKVMYGCIDCPFHVATACSTLRGDLWYHVSAICKKLALPLDEEGLASTVAMPCDVEASMRVGVDVGKRVPERARDATLNMSAEYALYESQHNYIVTTNVDVYM